MCPTVTVVWSSDFRYRAKDAVQIQICTNIIGLFISRSIVVSSLTTVDNIKLNGVCVLMAFKRQLFGTISTVLTLISCGGCIGHSTILLPQLKEEDSFASITNNELAWIGSIITLSSMIGNVVVAPLSQMCGRTTSLQISAAPMTIGWIVIALADSVHMLLLGKFLTGVAVGLQVPITSMYVGELSSPNYRSFFLACLPSSVCIGSTLSHLLGTYLRWRCTAYILSAFSVASAILFCYIPDSPSWMVSREMFEEARTAFKWYREPSETEEIENMIESKVTECLAYEKKRLEICRSVKHTMSNIRKVEFVKPLIVITLLVAMMQFSGISAYSLYGVQIINAIFKGDADAYTVILSLDALSICASTIACLVLKYIKRRMVLMLSSTLVCISVFFIAIFIYLKDADIITSGLNWFAWLILSIYISSISLGMVPLAWSLAGELFPLKTKSLCASTSSIINASLMFLASITALDMLEYFGMVGSYLFFGIVIIIITTILFFILPETKDRTLQEIEDGFKSKQSKYVTISKDNTSYAVKII